VCTTGGVFLDITNSDKSDPGAGIVCVPFEDVVSSARLAYYAARIFALLGA